MASILEFAIIPATTAATAASGSIAGKAQHEKLTKNKIKDQPNTSDPKADQERASILAASKAGLAHTILSRMPSVGQSAIGSTAKRAVNVGSHKKVTTG